MGKKEVLKIVADFRQALQAGGLRVQKIILFGSWARGDAGQDSDIDLVVISDDFEGKNYWDRVLIISEAVYQVFAPIEAVAMTSAEWDSGVSAVSQFARQGEELPV